MDRTGKNGPSDQAPSDRSDDEMRLPGAPRSGQDADSEGTDEDVDAGRVDPMDPSRT